MKSKLLSTNSTTKASLFGNMVQKTFYILLLGIWGCNNVPNDEIVITKFPETVDLTSSIISTDPVLLYPESMFIFENQLFVFQSKKDTLFDVFRLSDFKHTNKMGTKGGGPNEFIKPMGKTIQLTDRGFSILDYPFVKMIEVKDNGKLETIETIKAFKTLPVNGFSRINDSLFCSYAFCATGKTGDYEYQMVNRYTKSEKLFSPYPNLSDVSYEGDQRCQIYVKSRAVHPDGRFFVSFYSYFKFFRIYYYTGEIYKEVRVKVAPYESSNLDDWEKRMFYYTNPCATDKYIYVMCYNSNSGDSYPEIQVWDWNGNPIIVYHLDKQIFSYTISETDKKLYATTLENEDKIYIYNLKHL